MRRPVIALFDLDGTLVSCGGAGRRAMVKAFADFGAPPRVTEFDFGGMTDRAIARIGLRGAGLADDEATLDRFLARYLHHLRDDVPRSTRYRVLPGVLAVLDALAAHGHIAVGLGTGNLEEGARVKLAPARLHERFAFGGYGSDREDRAELLAIGAGRGAAHLGRSVSDCAVVVIGDTPRDVAAALAIGATCLAVATGQHPLAALEAAGAQHAVADLADPRALGVVLAAAT
jgi:phosphoglycolate phosphatase-like HAD superfamily hydrolase